MRTDLSRPDLPAAFLGWCLFYLLLASAWAGLIALDPAIRTAADFFARCLEPGADAGLGTLFLLWSLMSLGMMLPTSLPTLQRYALLVRQGARGQESLRFILFILGYALVWLGFSALAAALQRVLTQSLAAEAEPYLASALLVMAGLYQFSRLKNACLTRCRHPMTFFMAHWRDGLGGAIAMGLRHGRDCLGCCWALMALALIGGLMNLGFMALAVILMALEKLAGTGRFVTIPLGLSLVAGASFVLGNAWFAG